MKYAKLCLEKSHVIGLLFLAGFGTTWCMGGDILNGKKSFLNS